MRSVVEGAKTRASRRFIPGKRGQRRWRKLGVLLLVLVAVGIVSRAALPWALRNYVNRILDRNPLYSGKIGNLRIHLWRGAYSIHDVRISKTSGNVVMPF